MLFPPCCPHLHAPHHILCSLDPAAGAGCWCRLHWCVVVESCQPPWPAHSAARRRGCGGGCGGLCYCCSASTATAATTGRLAGEGAASSPCYKHSTASLRAIRVIRAEPGRASAAPLVLDALSMRSRVAYGMARVTRVEQEEGEGEQGS